jgi:hypothetical protein
MPAVPVRCGSILLSPCCHKTKARTPSPVAGPLPPLLVAGQDLNLRPLGHEPYDSRLRRLPRSGTPMVTWTLIPWSRHHCTSSRLVPPRLISKSVSSAGCHRRGLGSPDRPCSRAARKRLRRFGAVFRDTCSDPELSRRQQAAGIGSATRWTNKEPEQPSGIRRWKCCSPRRVIDALVREGQHWAT